MTQSPHNPVIFTQKKGDKVVAAFVVHVDNIYATGEKDRLWRIQQVLSNKFRMSKSGALDTYISLKVERGSDGVVFLNQKDYINRIADKHLSSSTCLAHVPCNSNFSDMTKDTKSPVTTKPYSDSYIQKEDFDTTKNNWILL